MVKFGEAENDNWVEKREESRLKAFSFIVLSRFGDFLHASDVPCVLSFPPFLLVLHFQNLPFYTSKLHWAAKVQTIETSSSWRLTLSRHFSLSFIASGRYSGLHPVSSQSCCMYVRAGRPAFARPYEGVHGSTSLMSSSLLLQQCPACLVRLTWIVFVMGGRWPYSWCVVGCCLQDLFNIAHRILV